MLEIIATTLRALTNDRRGVTAVEYTVIAALIIGAVATAFTTLGNDISSELAVIAGKV